MKHYVIRLAFLVLTTLVNAQSNTIKKIDELLKPYDLANQPGLSVRVVKGNEVLYSKSFGLSHLDYGIKNSDSTIYSIASISKQFTAAAIWSLITSKQLSLEDDVRTFLPEFPDYGEPVKIRHLLNHTGGIRGYHTLMYLSGFNYDKTYYDNNTVFDLACKQKSLNNIPGEKVIYSNTHYNILALIVEKISKTNLDDFLKTHILKPLGMTNTFVRISVGDVIKNRAIGYQNKGGVFKYNVTNQLSYGAGSMGSTLLDMTKWIQVLNGKVAKFKGLTQFLKTQELLPDHTKAKYARGIMVDDYKGYKTLSHSGYGFGGQNQLITVPSENLGVVIFTNLQAINPTPISYQILDILLPKKVVEVADEPHKEIKHKLETFVGDFKEVNSDMKMSFIIENDTLKAKGSFGRSFVSLVAISTNKFQRVNSANVKYDFTKSGQADLKIFFGGTPFYFKRAKFINPKDVNVSAFVGDYFSEELNVTYSFKLVDNKLVLSYKNNPSISLFPIQRNEFGNNNRTLYRFNKDKTKLFLSCDGTVKDIMFFKM